MTPSVPRVSESLSDAQIMQRSRTDASCFETLFERHHPPIYAYLRRRVGAEVTADLAADTFVTAFRLRGRYDGAHESARPWLFGIATNLLKHHWRRERRALRAYARVGTDPFAPAIDDSEDRADAEHARRMLSSALASLPNVEREALLLRYWAELSPAEIAEALEIPLGTVYSRLSRARADVRRNLGERETRA